MKHAVLGPGGVGGLIAALLARHGCDVIVVFRPTDGRAYPHEIRVTSTVYGEFSAPVRSTTFLEEQVDVLWITVKSTSLRTAIRSTPPDRVGNPLVIPLLNGFDHIALLRSTFGADAVVPAMIRTESTRTAPGRIRHGGWHVGPHPGAHGLVPTAPIQLASDGPREREVASLADELRSAGLDCQLWPDEGQVIWQKLALLAPYALATTAVAGAIGKVRSDPEVSRHLESATLEAVAVAMSLGVELDRDLILEESRRYPDGMRVSMERDLAAGNELEIANIADPVLREGLAHGVPVPSLEWLRQRAVQRVRQRA